MSAPHVMSIRVYYEDTDWSGRVYHANYLRFMERARTEFLRSLGVVQSTLAQEQSSLVFAVARIAVDYLRPAVMDDMLDVTTAVETARGPIVRLRQTVLRKDETLVRATVTVVALRDERMARLPESLRAAFLASQEG